MGIFYDRASDEERADEALQIGIMTPPEPFREETSEERTASEGENSENLQRNRRADRRKYRRASRGCMKHSPNPTLCVDPTTVHMLSGYRAFWWTYNGTMYCEQNSRRNKPIIIWEGQ